MRKKLASLIAWNSGKSLVLEKCAEHTDWIYSWKEYFETPTPTSLLFTLHSRGAASIHWSRIFIRLQTCTYLGMICYSAYSVYIVHLWLLLARDNACMMNIPVVTVAVSCVRTFLKSITIIEQLLNSIIGYLHNWKFIYLWIGRLVLQYICCVINQGTCFMHVYITYQVNMMVHFEANPVKCSSKT